MSDDYDDEDEPGGLWDPDAFAPPPAPVRPALHIVATPPPADRLDRRIDESTIPEEADHHTLVRLEQFQTASDQHMPQRSPATSPTLHRVAAAGILAIIASAIAISYGTLRSHERSDHPRSTPRAAAVLAVDSEHAAATRQVVSAGLRVRNSPQPGSRERQPAHDVRRSVTASHNRSARASPRRPTVSAARAAATSTTAVVRNAATARRQTPVANATSEFGFEG